MIPESFEDNSLIGKLTEVKKGDKLRLWNEESEIMGYVLEISEYKISLSTNHPMTSPSGFAHAMFLRTNNTIYDLRNYTDYSKQIDEE